MKILIIEDDINLGTILMGVLKQKGYEVCYLSNTDGIMEKFMLFQPDIILLDVNLNTRLDGFEIAAKIRQSSRVPILFATSRNSDEDIINGFHFENTDYLHKPYHFSELLLRLEKLLSKSKNDMSSNTEYRIGSYCFLPAEQVLQIDGIKTQLNKLETETLIVLWNNINVFICKRDLIEEVWHVKESRMKEASLNNVLSTLRKYLNTENCPIKIETKFKLGVRLTEKTGLLK